MAGEEFVRPSRDGDQFHYYYYYWAARQCLRLLPPGTTLVAIAIEGPAISDGQLLDHGAKSIDVAEYHGSTVPTTASHIRYVRLKHSSRRAEKEWLASELTDTLQDFGERYVALAEMFGTEDVAERFSFEFVTNRPFDDVRITRYVVVRPGHPAEAAPGNARARKGSRRRTGPASIQ